MKNLIFFLLPTLFLMGCSAQKGTQKKGKEQLVLITTDLGNIKIKLYNETPLHRDNFIQLVETGFYDSLLFHRVMNEFMIQGGDPESKEAKANARLGNGGNGQTIPIESVKKYYHKKGALAAARQPDAVNPKKASSGCQFYIVHGKKFEEKDLKNMQDGINERKRNAVFMDCIREEQMSEVFNRFRQASSARDYAAIKKIQEEVAPMVDERMGDSFDFTFSEEQIAAYSTLGGAPHLDGDYTVFGEVVEGLDVVDKIAAVKTNGSNRPLADIKMRMKLVKK